VIVTGILSVIVILVLIYLVASTKKSDKQRKIVLSEPVARAIEYIQQNYSNAELDLEEIAKAASISVNYLSTIFKKEMKNTVHNYLNSLRFEISKKLLKETSKNISEISYEVGFKDQSHFTKVFKALSKGQTPQKFRKIS
jgi:YesN/AraC family two-component response regulator